MIGFNLLGFMIFALVTSITPGPNNYILFAHGKSYGLEDAKKLILGILTGFFIMVYIAGYGIAELVTHNNTIGLVLKIVGSIWLLYLAFVLSKLNSVDTTNKPIKLSYPQAILMQFINPKAWVIAITGASAFMPHLGSIHLNVFVLAITFDLVGLPCMIIWIVFGDIISRLIRSDKANHILGYSLFLLMLVSIAMIWIE